ncbi:hypothetical protein HSR121_0451 [Halapricum desulfuricans]|uniref:Uncharacterized protein n=1 Tax=Halapricum desulfuricans TaxID=2841257 RepID=A0A897MWF8_9EURY|nr:hypothetical protein HSR121_0451 [Halapricum desulfuricans]
MQISDGKCQFLLIFRTEEGIHVDNAKILTDGWLSSKNTCSRHDPHYKP